MSRKRDLERRRTELLNPFRMLGSKVRRDELNKKPKSQYRGSPKSDGRQGWIRLTPPKLCPTTTAF